MQFRGLHPIQLWKRSARFKKRWRRRRRKTADRISRDKRRSGCQYLTFLRLHSIHPYQLEAEAGVEAEVLVQALVVGTMGQMEASVAIERSALPLRLPILLRNPAREVGIVLVRVEPHLYLRIAQKEPQAIPPTVPMISASLRFRYLIRLKEIYPARPRELRITQAETTGGLP
jgi:hypothetical protein